jgi:hypothetical protein
MQAEHNHDLIAYCATLLAMNAVNNTSAHNEELITTFLMQTNTHPSEIVHAHFNLIGVKFFLKCNSKSQSFSSLLGNVDHVHMVTTSPSLPFTASMTYNNKSQEYIAALASMLQKQTGQMQKLIAAVSQIDNRVKQKFDTFDDKTKGNTYKKKQKGDDPLWMCNPPSDSQEVREQNKKNWYFCATCRHWSTMHSSY